MTSQDSNQEFRMTVFDDILSLNKAQKLELVKSIWKDLPASEADFNENDYIAYFKYVQGELSLLQEHQSSFAAQTLDSTLAIIDEVRQNPAVTREDIARIIAQKHSESESDAVLRSVELAVRAWLTLNIRSDELTLGPVYAGTSRVDWPHYTTLKQSVGFRFPQSKAPDPPDKIPMNPEFTASFLTKGCGVRILWTDNLADHLILNRHNMVLTLYQHKICIFNHLQSSDAKFFPEGLLEETIDTFNLLLPFGDRQTQRLLANHQSLWGLGGCGRYRQLDLAQYQYWRWRLEDLYALFNEPPRNLRHLWVNRRNVVNWITVWVAVAAAVLAVFGCIFGSVSMAYSILQYRFMVEQACIDPDTAAKMPKYCGQRNTG